MDWSSRRLHFIGIGGAGMSGLALVGRALGASVTGSDRAESSYSTRLRSAGVAPVIGHAAENVPAGAEVVVSTAIAGDNPELERARELGLRVLHRGDLLAEAAGLKHSIAVAGAHGKTTTAAMAAHVLAATGRDPAYLIGGEVRATGTNAAWGEGAWIVVEADESDRSFLKLAPDVAVITNVELDHHATYRSDAELRAAFSEFAGGAAERVVWARAGVEGLSFGIGEGDLRADDVELVPLGSRFTVDGVAIELRVPGEHNVLNALAALGACRAAGVGVEEAAAALAGFTGTGRRFEPRGNTASGAVVYDDYAHHPTEVAATLEAARTLAPRRLVACFQPHLYSRTQALARDFGRALARADAVMVVDVYAAREDAADYPGVSGWLVAAAAATHARGRSVWWVPELGRAAAVLSRELGPGDVLVTLGAGNVDEVAAELTS